MSDRRQGSHLAPVLAVGGFAVWWWLTVLGGGVLLAYAVRHLSLQDLIAAGAGYWLLGCFVVLGELRPIVASNRTDPEGVNLATAFLFAVLLQWGFDLAVLSVTIATVIGEAARRKRVYAAAFNVAQYTLSYGAAALILRLGGGPASPTAPGELFPAELLVVLGAAAAYHLTNLGVVGTAIGLLERRPVVEAIRTDFAYYTVTTGAVLALSPLVVIVLEKHWGFLPLLLLPLFLLWTTARMSLEREHRALSDELTGLANRSRLADLVAARDVSGAAEGPAALCLLDLDRFKEVNDTLGHATGDDLLRAVAGRLAVGLREGDTAARIGGDEFVLLLGVADLEEAEHAVQRIVDRLRSPYDVAGMRLEVEVSAGIVMLPEHGDDLALLLRRADAAMYEAKSGGEAVSRFRPELDRHEPSRLQLLADLRRAVGAGELELHYQPQVAISDGAVLGVEALLRWRHPRLGLLLPDSFLPLADRTATMRQVTAAVLELALEQLAEWERIRLRVPIAINVSLHDLADGGFADMIVAAAARNSVPAEYLHLEVTEGALVSDPSRVLATLKALDAAGVRLSLDDFGTGHASLTRLKSLPVDEVKIDRQFVVGLDTGDPRDVAVVRTVIELARALGLRSVAEGVETSQQWDTLATLGCDAVQGWFVAAAMPADVATTWLLGHAGGRAVAAAAGDPRRR